MDMITRAVEMARARYPGRSEVAAEVADRLKNPMVEARIAAARSGLLAVTAHDALKPPLVRESEALERFIDSVARSAAVPATAVFPHPVAPPAKAAKVARAMKTPEANQINALSALQSAKTPGGGPMFDLMAIPRLEGRKSPAKQYLMQHLRLSDDAAKLALSALERDGKIKYADPVKTTR